MATLITIGTVNPPGTSTGRPLPSTVSASSPQETPAEAPKAAPSRSENVGTKSLIPEVDVTTTEIAPAPQTPASSPNDSPQDQPAPSSTIIPPIPISPISSQSSKATRQSRGPTPTPTPTPLPPEQTSFQTIFLTTTEPPATPTSSAKSNGKSSSSSAQPSLLSNGSPFGDSKGDQPAHKGKSSSSTVAGVVGGLSAAILLGVLIFFLWKWKTRGKYRFNKRQSFGPYGNGIDANRGGLLVSSVACKPTDSNSNEELKCKCFRDVRFMKICLHTCRSK
jgi:hypothetical protein